MHSLSTTHFCDAQTDIRLLNHSIKPLYFAGKFFGKAFTVKCDGDILPVMKALELIQENQVLIINSSNSPNAILGEIFTTVAKNKKIQGIIIDGYCRDIFDIRNLGISLYAKGVCLKVGTKNKIGALQTEVTIGDVTIRPNEYVFGDENGVIFFSEEESEALITKAEQIKQHEEKALAKIRNGNTLNDVLNFYEHYENVVAGLTNSQLSWNT